MWYTYNEDFGVVQLLFLHSNDTLTARTHITKGQIDIELTMRTTKKSSKKGIPLNLMVVGDVGLGRTAFINTLCEKPLIRHNNNFDPAEASSVSPVEIVPYQTGKICIKAFQCDIHL